MSLEFFFDFLYSISLVQELRITELDVDWMEYGNKMRGHDVLLGTVLHSQLGNSGWTPGASGEFKGFYCTMGCPVSTRQASRPVQCWHLED